MPLTLGGTLSHPPFIFHLTILIHTPACLSYHIHSSSLPLLIFIKDWGAQCWQMFWISLDIPYSSKPSKSFIILSSSYHHKCCHVKSQVWHLEWGMWFLCDIALEITSLFSYICSIHYRPPLLSFQPIPFTPSHWDLVPSLSLIASAKAISIVIQCHSSKHFKKTPKNQIYQKILKTKIFPKIQKNQIFLKTQNQIFLKTQNSIPQLNHEIKFLNPSIQTS